MYLNSKTEQAIWHSPFRPFFLLGALYGPILEMTGIPHYTGLIPSMGSPSVSLPTLWHQHEIVFGFSTAIIFGFILTALPSWAGTDELKKNSLILLVCSWLPGRLAVAFSGLLPLPLVAFADRSFLPVFVLQFAPGLRNVNFRTSMGLLVIAADFFAGNPCYYLGVLQQDQQLWQGGLRIGLYAMIFHCSVTLGILGSIFTENALLEDGRPTDIGHVAILKRLSAASIIALAVADIGAASAPIGGALGLMSLGLMTLVTLHHTGRELRPHPAMVAAYLVLAAAALLRVAVPVGSLGRELLLLSALLWVAPYLIYLHSTATCCWHPAWLSSPTVLMPPRCPCRIDNRKYGEL